MDRNEKILHLIDRAGQGIEIGPGYSPVAPKRQGFRVQIIDHLNREQLVSTHKKSLEDFISDGDKPSIDDIEEVDFIWKGQSYQELTGKTKFYDWIIASHVIEHTPDLIGFLKDCDSIIKDDAVVSLVIPDKRFCFDCFRPLTGISQIIDAHMQERRSHSPGTVAEHFLSVAVKEDGRILWGEGDKVGYRPLDYIDKARSSMAEAIDEGKYFDIHGHGFTPHSFRMIIEDLYQLGFSPFREMDFFSTGSFEFFMTLGRKGEGHGLERLEMLKRIDAEQNHESLRELAEMREQLDRLAAERDEALKEIDRIHASHSWKVTGPLRRIGPAAADYLGRIRKPR